MFKKIFSHTLLGFTNSEYTKRIYRTEKPVNFRETDKFRLKSDFLTEVISMELDKIYFIVLH